jgi:hypothetical protein
LLRLLFCFVDVVSFSFCWYLSQSSIRFVLMAFARLPCRLIRWTLSTHDPDTKQGNQIIDQRLDRISSTTSLPLSRVLSEAGPNRVRPFILYHHPPTPGPTLLTFSMRRALLAREKRSRNDMSGTAVIFQKVRTQPACQSSDGDRVADD